MTSVVGRSVDDSFFKFSFVLFLRIAISMTRSNTEENFLKFYSFLILCFRHKEVNMIYVYIVIGIECDFK